MVASGVGFDRGASFGGDVEGGDLARAVQGAGKGEAALVAEAVENALAARMLRNQRVVVSLVKVETGFLSAR